MQYFINFLVATLSSVFTFHFGVRYYASKYIEHMEESVNVIKSFKDIIESLKYNINGSVARETQQIQEISNLKMMNADLKQILERTSEKLFKLEGALRAEERSRM